MATAYCTSCGQAVGATSRFCPGCGAPRQPAAAPAAPPGTVGGAVAAGPGPAPLTVQAPAAAGFTRCPHCGSVVMAGSRICALCRRPLIAEGAPAATAESGLGFSVEGIKAWLAQLRQLGWKKIWPLALTAAFLVFYVVLTLDPWPLVFGMGIAFVVRKFADKIDDRLKPLWPYREKVPRKYRMVLAWVLPMILGFIITGSPTLFYLFAWLPFLGPDASLFFFLTVMSAFIAYVLIRQPRRGVAP